MLFGSNLFKGVYYPLYIKLKGFFNYIYCIIQFNVYLNIMEAAQALMKFYNKPKTKTKTKTKTIDQKPIPHIMCISQREYDWYSRLCPNFNQNKSRILIKTYKE